MSALAVPFRQLVERRLWPLALLLLAALAAVPIMLSKSEEPALPGPVASAATAGTATTSALANQPIVSVGDETALDARRKVLGKRKNPFKPAVAPKKAKAAEAQAPNSATGGANSPTSGGGVTITPGGGLVVTPDLPKKVYEVNSLTVRFGQSSAEKLNRRNLKRLTSLPSVSEPVIIYLGLQSDGKTAVFLVDAMATVQGDGRCNPNPENCQTLHLRPGETAFFDVGATTDVVSGGQYQLDFIKVKKSRTTDAKAAARERRAVAAGGRAALRARSSRIGGYRYDSRTGTLKKLSSRQLKAEAAARAARANR